MSLVGKTLVVKITSKKAIIKTIDEFYYRHKFDNKFAKDNGVFHSPVEGFNTTLVDLYNIIISARKKGLRMHYWPVV